MTGCQQWQREPDEQENQLLTEVEVKVKEKLQWSQHKIDHKIKDKGS